MKETYIKPETSICRLNAEHAILVVSNIPVNGGPTDAEQLSKQHSSGGYSGIVAICMTHRVSMAVL